MPLLLTTGEVHMSECIISNNLVALFLDETKGKRLCFPRRKALQDKETLLLLK